MNYIYSLVRLFGLSLVFMCLLGGADGGQALEAPWYNGKWAHEQSDLTPDPAVTFGRLDNGFRYAVIPHAFPAGRVSMMLNIQVGSLMENDEELGYAHFVEHMAFNGSKNFKPGELIPFFQKHGMSFGGDTNAHTSFTETVYKLNLADNSLESVALGAKVLRDFADGLLFAEDEVRDELGVILSEKRTRDNESLRANRKKRENIFGGTRFVNDIIGTDATLNAVSGEKLKKFYDRWYRPERMMLVVVGDIAIESIERLISQSFTDMMGRGDAGVVADWGEGKASGLRAIYQERPYDAVVVSLQTLHGRHFEQDSKKSFYQKIMAGLADFCLQQRLDRLREEQPGVWVSSSYDNWQNDPMFPLTSLTAVTTQKDWEKSLVALSDSLRSALQYGFTQEELNLALQQFKTSLEGQVQARKRMPSEALSLSFITQTNSGNVFTAEEYDLALFEEFSQKIRLEDMNNAFQKSFSPDNMTVYVTGPEKFLNEKTIITAYEKAQQRPVEKVHFAGVPEFPYLPLPEASSKLPQLSEKKLSSDESAPVLYTAQLRNGMKVHLLRYPVEAGKIQANLVFGVGARIYEDDASPVLDMLNSTLQVTGVGKLDSQESQLLFDYRDMAIQEYVGSMRSVIAGSGKSEDVELLLQAMWTQFKDPQISEKDRSRVLKTLELQQRLKKETVDGVSQTIGRNFFYGNALRFTDLSPERAQTVTLADMGKILKDSRHTPLPTILISGDFTANEVLPMVARLFEGEHFVQDRDEAASLMAAPKFPSKGDKEIAVPQDPVAKSILRLVIQNNILESDRKGLAERTLLAEIVADRLREQLREKMGVIYGASVRYGLLADRADSPGYGLFTVALVTGQEHITKVKEVVNTELALLAKDEVSVDELERIRKPLMTGWETERKKLYAWNTLQLGEIVKGHPYVQWDNAYGKLMQQITPKDLKQTAGELFKNGIDASLLIYSQGHEAQ